MYKIFINENNEVIEANIDLVLTMLKDTSEAVVMPSNKKELLILQDHSRVFNLKNNYEYACKNYLKNNEKFLKRGEYDR